jgi:hypothetical protein
MELSNEVSNLAREQCGLLTRAQLLGSGVTPGQLRSRLTRSWRVILPGVVLLGPEAPSQQQRLTAALLYAGPESRLAGPTAAALHGLQACAVTNPVHVQVPVPRRSRTKGWVSVRNTVLVDERLVQRGSLRLSCVPRSVVDAAALAPNDEGARAIMIEAVQRRLTRLDDLAHWVQVRGTQAGSRLRRALEEAATGAWSVPEADLLRLLGSSRILPEPWANPQLRDATGRRLTTPDAWLDDVGMAIMVHSQRYHAGALDWDATVEADSDLQAAGALVIGVTPRAIAREPRRTLERVERAWQTASESGRRPAVTATRQDPWRISHLGA